ncbi:MAG: DUF3656 domain-containing protein, partial [Anaerolineae bacterium]|nr:DUF3656 domain-containing protein [Anaerolineae bacterium]
REGIIVTPNAMDDIQVGATIYRNHDHAFLADVQQQAPVRTIGVLFTLSQTGDGVELTAEDEDGNRATITLKQNNAAAHKPDKATETARRQLAKTGGTPFHCEGVVLGWDQPLFLPFSTLNELRRDVLDRLAETRAANRPMIEASIEPNSAPYPEPSLTFHGNVLNAQARAFYRRHGVTDIEPAAESGLDLSGRTVMTTRYCIREELGWCPRQGNPGRPNGPLFLIDEGGHRYEVHFHCDQAPDGCGMDISF